MKTDKRGCSTCPAGQEHYEAYVSPSAPGMPLIQYDYRHEDGELFSTVAASLQVARSRRDSWLERKRKVWAGCHPDPKAVDPYGRL